MSDDHPLSSAWKRVRAEAAELAAERRAAGAETVEAVADHAAARVADGRLSLVFTVPDGDAAEVSQFAADHSATNTRVHYVDVDGHRCYVLEVDADGGAAVAVIVGAVAHDRLTAAVDADPDDATTVVRRVDDTQVHQLHHESAVPFLADLPDAE